MNLGEIEKSIGEILTLLYNANQKKDYSLLYLAQTKLSKLRGDIHDERKKLKVINSGEPFLDTV